MLEDRWQSGSFSSSYLASLYICTYIYVLKYTYTYCIYMYIYKYRWQRETWILECVRHMHSALHKIVKGSDARGAMEDSGISFKRIRRLLSSYKKWTKKKKMRGTERKSGLVLTLHKLDNSLSKIYMKIIQCNNWFQCIIWFDLETMNYSSLKVCSIMTFCTSLFFFHFRNQWIQSAIKCFITIQY